MLQLISKKSHSNHIPQVLHNDLKGIRYFRPLATRNIVMQQRGCLKQAVLETLARRRWQKEMQIACSVERCHHAIEAQVNAFITREAKSLGLYAASILQGKTKAANCLLQEFLSPLAIDKLLDSMKHSIQLELKECFGAVSVDITAFQYSATDSAVIGHLANSIDEYRNTLLLAKVATEAGDQAWEKALSKIDLHPVIGKILKKIKIGSIAMTIAGCDHELLVEQYRRQLEQEMAGILFNVTHKVKMLMRNKAAQVFYGIYDNTYGRYLTSLEHTARTDNLHKAGQVEASGDRFKQQAI